MGSVYWIFLLKSFDFSPTSIILSFEPCLFMRPAILSKASILIIDDSEELLEVLTLILERQGYAVITKNCAKDITSFVQNTHIDLLFLDVLLLGIDGRDICKELKSDPATAYFPIILMSATPKYLLDFKVCNADDFLEKPFDINFLLSKIDGVLGTIVRN